MTQARSRELGEFLRARRERLQPVDVGLAGGGRRRTPGLRREEVAALSAVGTTWYTWLEQGRAIHPSVEVLTAISTALLLDPTERAHLLALGGHPGAGGQQACSVVSEATQLMLDALAPNPAVIQNPQFHILACNQPYRFLIDDLFAHPEADRNSAYLHFVDPAWRRAHGDDQVALATIVGKLRSYWADSADDPAWGQLIGRLVRESPEFAVLWAGQDVQRPGSFAKDLDNVHVGVLELTATNLQFEAAPRTRLVTYTPRTPTAAVRLRQLQDLIDTGTLGAAAGATSAPGPAATAVLADA